MLTVEMLMLQEGLPDATLGRLERIYRQMEQLAEMVADLTSRHHRTLSGHRLLNPLTPSALPARSQADPD